MEDERNAIEEKVKQAGQKLEDTQKKAHDEVMDKIGLNPYDGNNIL